MRRPPKAWKPPDPYDQRLRRMPKEAKALAAAVYLRVTASKHFPAPGSRGTLRELRLLAVGLGFRIEEARLPPGEAGRARETMPGSGEWVIVLNAASPLDHKREALMHEITEIFAAEMVPTPDFAHMLFNGDTARMRQYIGGDGRNSLPHLAAVAAEPIWCKRFDWYEAAAVAWERHINALAATSAAWHKQYWESGRHQGEMESCRIEGVDY